MSLSDYLRVELTRQAKQLTLDEVLARIETRQRTEVSSEEIVAAVRAGRDGTDLL